MTTGFENLFAAGSKSSTTSAWPMLLSTSLKTIFFPSGENIGIIAYFADRPVNAIVAPVVVLYITLALGPIMPGLFTSATGKRAVTLVLSADSPAVRRRDPSGYTALKPQSSAIVVARPVGFVAFGRPLVSLKLMLPGEARPPGYECFCATSIEPSAESEWHEMHGPIGTAPAIARSAVGLESPGLSIMTAPLLPAIAEVYVL